MVSDWIYLGIVVVVFVLSALPLRRAVKIMKGKTTLLKTLEVMIIAGLVIGAITFFLKVWGGLIAFVVLIWIYKVAFKLKWHRAVLVWVLHLIFVTISSILLGLLVEVFSWFLTFV